MIVTRHDRGVNWVSTMDVALRAMNWLWGYYFFMSSSELTDAFRIKLFLSLYMHGRHIINNLEWSEKLTSNHYLANLSGLIYIGVLMPEFKDARKWKEFGLRELEREIFKQVYPDGVSFEASISYHRLATELILYPTLLASLNGHTFSSQYMERLAGMINFIQVISRPDGTVPLLGDNDNGRVHRLKVWVNAEREWVDYRYLLAIGGVLFENQDWARAAEDQWEEAVWLTGEKAIEYINTLSASRSRMKSGSRVFSSSGLVVMRKDSAYLAMRAGNNGQNGFGGHAHNDCLSFVLSTYTGDWLIDPGTFAYTSDYVSRSLFRSTAYHNTVQIDGEEQNRLEPRNPFLLADDTQAKIISWDFERDYDLVRSLHHGYNRGNAGIIHIRQIYFNKKGQMYWLIRDHFTGEGLHNFIWRFHPPNIHVHITDHIVHLQQPAGERLDLIFIDCEPKIAIQGGWISTSYGSKTSSPVIECRLEAVAPLASTLLVYHPENGSLPLNDEDKIYELVEPALAHLRIDWEAQVD